MAIRVEHDMHRRRFSRNLGLGLVLAGFVALVFTLTLVKVSEGARPHAGDAKKNSGSFVEPVAKAAQP